MNEAQSSTSLDGETRVIEPRIHYLKTWPEPFQAIIVGTKRFEFRRDDRGFAVGDVLVLMYWDPTPGRYGPTGHSPCPCKWTAVRVDYLTRGFGIPDGYCCMSVTPLRVPPCDTPSELRGICHRSFDGWVEARGAR